MKRYAVLLGALAFLVCFTIGVQAQTTITFEEIPAWNSTPASGGTWIGEEYGAVGIHFLANTLPVVPVEHDGVIYDDGMLSGIPSVPVGTQYLGLAATHPDGGIGNVGMVLQFDEYQTMITMDAYGMGGAQGMYWLFDTAQGTGFGTDLFSAQFLPPVNTWGQVTIGDGSVQFDLVLIAGAFAAGAQVIAVDNITFTGIDADDAPLLTGIQITGLSSDIMGNVIAGATVTFTVSAVTATGVGPLNYRFYTRKGYESIADAANPWGGNSWQLKQNWSAMNSASIPFNEPGFYFMAVHFSEDTTWSAAQGGPQTGMVVEVSPAQE